VYAEEDSLAVAAQVHDDVRQLIGARSIVGDMRPLAIKKFPSFSKHTSNVPAIVALILEGFSLGQ
jgi:hypothetical protein